MDLKPTWKGWVALLGVLALGPIGCGSKAPAQKTLVLTYESPLDSANLTDANDIDPNTPGLQVDVRVKAEVTTFGESKRDAADLEYAILEYRRAEASELEFLPGPTADLSSPGEAIFHDLSLGTGSYVLRLRAKQKNLALTAENVRLSLTSQSSSARPEVLTVSFVGDENGDGRLNQAELPSFPVIAKVTTISADTGTVVVKDQVSGTEYGRAAFSGNAAQVNLNGLPQDNDHTYALVFDVQNGAGISNQLADNVPGDPKNAAAFVSLVIDRSAPVVTITAPTAQTYLVPSIPVSVSVAGAEGQVVTLSSTIGGDRGTLTVVSGVAQGNIAFLDGTQNVTATVRDAAGNSGSATVSGVVFDAAPCALTMISPAADPAYLNSTNDSDPGTTGFQFQIQGHSATCSNVSGKVLLGATEVCSLSVGATGDFSCTVTLPVGQSAVTIILTKRPGLDTTQTLTLNVDTSALVFLAPVDGQQLNIARDINAAPGIQSSLVYSPPPPPGGAVDLCSNAQLSPSATPCANGATGWFTLAADIVSQTAQLTFPDGQYQLRIVQKIGGTFSGLQSAPISVKVDSVRPTVTAFAFQGDANADKRLNATELPSGQPTALITVSESATVAIRNVAGGTVYGSVTTPASGTIAVPLTNLPPTNEGDFQLEAVLVDAAANQNQLTVGAAGFDTLARSSLRIDRVPPVWVFSAPSKSLLGIADDASNSAGYQLRVSGITSSDVTSTGVAMVLSGASNGVGAPAPVGGVASYDFTVASTGVASYSVSVTVADIAGNTSGPFTRNVTVDNDAPVPQIIAPSGVNSAFNLSTQVSVPGEDGVSVQLFSQVGTNPEQFLGTLTVSSGTASGTIGYPPGTQVLRALVADAAGNVGQDTRSITVNGVGCPVVFLSPALLGKAQDSQPASPTTLEYAVQGTSYAACAGRPVNLYSVVSGTPTLVGSATADPTGQWSVAVSLPEGVTTLRAEVDDGAGHLNTYDRDFTVDLTPPGLSPTAPSVSPLFVVASTNINLLAPAVPGYLADANPSVADGQVNFSFDVTGAAGGTAKVLFGGSPLFTQSIVASGTTTVAGTVSLTHATSGVFRLSVVDAAGNESDFDMATTVDVIAPGAPTLSLALQNSRLATLRAGWTQSYDDGAASASGPVAGYDLRWATSVSSVSGIDSEATYFNALKAHQESFALLPPGTVQRDMSVPPLTTYSVVLRAVDEVGNYSPMPVAKTMDNFWNTAQLVNPGANSSYGRNLSAADFDGDGFADLAVSANAGSTAPGSVFVYFGAASLPSARRQDLVGETNASLFGWDVSAGNVGESTQPDLLVGAQNYGSAIGRAYLYFGVQGGNLDSTPVIFQGNAGSRLGTSARVIPDLNGDGLSEIALGAPNDHAGQGVVYIFFGRSKAAFQALAVSGAIPVASADRFIDGPINQAPATAFPVNGFGVKDGFAAVGDVDGDGVTDFTVPASKDNVNLVFVFSGKAIADAGPGGRLSTGNGSVLDQSLQRIADTLPNGAGFTTEGFGSEAGAAVNLLATAGYSLALSRPLSNVLYIYPRGSGSSFDGSSRRTVTGTNNFSASLAVGDLTGDGKPDILVGEGVGTGVTTNRSVWLLVNRGTSGQEFDSQSGSGFYQARLQSPSSLGFACAVGDFNGDGNLDAASSDNTDGAGKVTLWF